MKIFYSKKETIIKINGEESRLNVNLHRDSSLEKYKKELEILINKNKNNHFFWKTRLMEKNNISDDFFHRLTLIEAISQIKEEKTIYTNDLLIYLYFKKRANISLKDRTVFNLLKIKEEYVNPLKTALSFSKSIFMDTILLKRAKKVKDLYSKIVIIDLVKKENITKSSDYKYIESELNKRNLPYIKINVLVNGKPSSIKKVLKENNLNLLCDYRSIQDIFFIFYYIYKLRSINLNNLEKERKEIYKHKIKSSKLDLALNFYLLTRKINKKNRITFIQNFEGNSVEKAINRLSIKTDASVIGMFHTSKPRGLLSLTPINETECFYTNPTYISFNSDVYKKYYEENFNIKAISSFSRKTSKCDLYKKDKPSGRDLMVLFPGDFKKAKELLEIIKNIKSFYYVRGHPLLNKFLEKEFPKERIRNNGSLSDSLIGINKVMAGYSAAAIEAAVKGIKVGFIPSRREIELNPFDDTGIKYTLIRNEGDLQSFIEDRSVSGNAIDFYRDKEENLISFVNDIETIHKKRSL